MKVYLICNVSLDYNKYNFGNYTVVTVASSLEKAKIIKKYLQERNKNLDVKYQIWEFEADVINPIGDITETEITTSYGEEKLLYKGYYPYKIIKEERNL